MPRLKIWIPKGVRPKRRFFSWKLAMNASVEVAHYHFQAVRADRVVRTGAFCKKDLPLVISVAVARRIAIDESSLAAKHS